MDGLANDIAAGTITPGKGATFDWIGPTPLSGQMGKTVPVCVFGHALYRAGFEPQGPLGGNFYALEIFMKGDIFGRNPGAFSNFSDILGKLTTDNDAGEVDKLPGELRAGAGALRTAMQP
jgi:hypothetical protein